MQSNMTKRFKIEPDLTCPELARYKLPPFSRGQEDGVEKLSDESNGYLVFSSKAQGTKAMAFDEGFKSGYKKAREKFEFSESQLRQALSMAFIAVQDGGNITSDEIIQSLRTPRHPIAIDVEMVESPSYNAIRMQDKNDCFAYFIPATNPDGTVKGVYVYE